MNLSVANNSVVEIKGLSLIPNATRTKQEWSSNVKYSDIGVYIEQMDPKTAVIFDSDTAFKMFTMFVSQTLDIIEGDQVTDDHGRRFVVQGVQNYRDNADVSNHMEIVMVQRYPKN